MAAEESPAYRFLREHHEELHILRAHVTRLQTRGGSLLMHNRRMKAALQTAIEEIVNRSHDTSDDPTEVLTELSAALLNTHDVIFEEKTDGIQSQKEAPAPKPSAGEADS